MRSFACACLLVCACASPSARRIVATPAATLVPPTSSPAPTPVATPVTAAPAPTEAPTPLPAKGMAVAARGAPAGKCKASWYGDAHAGRRTSSGQPFDPTRMTAAHLTLPFGAVVRVHHGGRAVDVSITDRGPARWTGRCIDLARAAFAQLSPLGAGVIPVRLERVA